MDFKRYGIFILLIISAFISSCGPRLSSRAEEYLSQSDEVPECLTTQTYSPSITVVATAKFFKRSTKLVLSDTNELLNMTLGDPLTDALPIPFAEVAVYDQNKKLVQCGKTDIDGNIVAVDGISALNIPTTVQSYIIKVYARTRTTLPNKGIQAITSIKQDIYKNQVYNIETTFSSDGTNLSPITLLAYARQTDDVSIRGGAFNIYNNFIQTYLYLDNSLTVPNNQLSCLSTKLNVFWQAGFNPIQYLYPTSDPSSISDNTSYFDKETPNSLFITGGQVGDISMSNTDHFDDFPVIHEIGHFIEYHCGKLTKAGNHSLTVRIDQRLAWHESWSNFIAAAVIKNRIDYIDPTMTLRLSSINETSGWTFLNNTYGFSDSFQNISNGTGFMMDFKKPGNNPGEWQIGVYADVHFDIVNTTLYPGEGHTREGAISRALFKTTQTCDATCTATPASFTEIWQAFDAYTGMGQTVYNLVSSNLFFEIFKTVVGGASWAANYKTIVEAEAMQLFSEHNLTSVGTKKYVTTVSSVDYLTWIPFGHNLIVNNSCTNKTLIQARTDDVVYTGLNSDQRYSNHFYTLDPATLSGLTTLSVKFDFLNGSATDHDILIFEDTYHYNEDYACNNSATSCSSSNYVVTRTNSSDVVASNRSPTNTYATPGATFTKSISNLNTLLNPNKKYVLNIRAYTAGRSLSSSTQYAYTISSNLGTLCPE